jgi:hypothetical protein
MVGNLRCGEEYSVTLIALVLCHESGQPKKRKNNLRASESVTEIRHRSTSCDRSNTQKLTLLPTNLIIKRLRPFLMLRHRHIIQPSTGLDQRRSIVRYQLIPHPRGDPLRDEAHDEVIPGLHARGIVGCGEDPSHARFVRFLVFLEGARYGGEARVTGS